MVVAFLISGPFGWQLAAYLCAAVFSGVCIGATGVGGILLTPLLLLCGVPVHQAGMAVLASLLLTGFTAAASNWNRLPKRRAARLCLAALPSAVLGAIIFPYIPPIATGCFLSFVSVVSGSHIVYQESRRVRTSTSAQPSSESVARAEEESATAANVPASAAAAGAVEPVSPPQSAVRAEKILSMPFLDMALGLACGFFSVLTCTGGPFILLPMLFAADASLPPADAVAIAQTLCIPVPASALLIGAISPATTVDVGLALAIGLALALGVPAGVRISRRLKPARLKLLVGACMLVSGAMALLRTIDSATRERPSGSR